VIPSIDYLTLVLAGTVLWYIGTEPDAPTNFERVVGLVGIALFLVGAIRATMSAFGL